MLKGVCFRYTWILVERGKEKGRECVCVRAFVPRMWKMWKKRCFVRALWKKPGALWPKQRGMLEQAVQHYSYLLACIHMSMLSLFLKSHRLNCMMTAQKDKDVLLLTANVKESHSFTHPHHRNSRGRKKTNAVVNPLQLLYSYFTSTLCDINAVPHRLVMSLDP